MKREAVGNTKMKKLCKRLGCRLYMSIGILEGLWHLTAREAPQGDIGKLSNEDIALGLDYEGDADKLIDALVECHWLDESPDNRLVVHDWHEHADDAVKKRLMRTHRPFLSGYVQTTAAIGGQRQPSADNGSLPVPVPEPVPEPGGELPAPPDDANPLQCALWLAESINQVFPAGTNRLIADALKLWARELRLQVSKAAVMALNRARESIARGEIINTFWFTDGKFKRDPPSNRPFEPGVRPPANGLECWNGHPIQSRDVLDDVGCCGEQCRKEYDEIMARLADRREKERASNIAELKRKGQIA